MGKRKKLMDEKGGRGKIGERNELRGGQCTRGIPSSSGKDSRNAQLMMMRKRSKRGEGGRGRRD